MYLFSFLISAIPFFLQRPLSFVYEAVQTASMNVGVYRLYAGKSHKPTMQRCIALSVNTEKSGLLHI